MRAIFVADDRSEVLESNGGAAFLNRSSESSNLGFKSCDSDWRVGHGFRR
jgi:hypothetical protein